VPIALSGAVKPRRLRHEYFWPFLAEDVGLQGSDETIVRFIIKVVAQDNLKVLNRATASATFAVTPRLRLEKVLVSTECKGVQGSQIF